MKTAIFKIKMLFLMLGIRLGIAFLMCLLLFQSQVKSSEFSDAETDKKFLGEIVGAVKSRNTVWIAEHMIYPISVVSNGKTQVVKSKDEFIAIAKQKLTDKICAEIVDSAQKPLFKNWKGVMLGDGILWFLEYKSNEHSPSQYGISAIGYFAFQPDEMAPSDH